jgi:nucleotide-binding universal stress UspA family protein
VLIGSAASRIVEYADQTHADLIVMGKHGRSAFGHLLLGSVAEKVVRTARCPVLTAKESTPQTVAA